MRGHTLIAGVAGSGKSYTEHKFVEMALAKNAEVVLLDPKMVELREYAENQSVICYADYMDSILMELDNQCYEMENRYNEMIERKLKMWDGKDRFIFLDESADLFIQNKREATRVLSRLSMLGRAARFWLVLCTQRATADVIPRSVIINLDNIVCLRQAKAVDSNQLIGRPGAEKLPRIGYGFLKTPDIPVAQRMETDNIINKLWEG